MTITAKFSSTCPTCNVRIAKGERVEWSRGAPARHVDCSNPRELTEAQAAGARHDLKCWTCDRNDASFRAEGATTPVRCDACQEKAEKAKRRARGDCPTCGGPMPRRYAAKGYQCDNCADRDEGISFGMSG